MSQFVVCKCMQYDMHQGNNTLVYISGQSGVCDCGKLVHVIINMFTCMVYALRVSYMWGHSKSFVFIYVRAWSQQIWVHVNITMFTWCCIETYYVLTLSLGFMFSYMHVVIANSSHEHHYVHMEVLKPKFMCLHVS